jgi:high-affinity iron transporter
VVLFLYGILASGTSGSALALGGVLGIVAGAAFTGLTYFGLLAMYLLMRIARAPERPRAATV